MRHRWWVLGLLALAACGGDYRNGYVGTWTGSDSLTLTGANPPPPFSVQATVDIGLAGSNGLVLNGFECTPMTATANSSAVFDLDTPVSCPVSAADQNYNCTYQFTYASGSGARSGTSLTFSATGTVSWVCTDTLGNTITDNGSFTESASLVR